MRTRLLAACLALAPAGVALGHSTVTTSDPTAGARVTTPPRTVTVTFSTQILRVTKARVLSPAGVDVVTSVRVSPTNVRRAVLRVSAGRPGRYRVAVTVVGADAHQVARAFSYTVVTP